MPHEYKTCVIYPKGLRVSGDDQSDKLAECLEKKSNALAQSGWDLTTVTPTLTNAGSVSKLLVTFCRKIHHIPAGKNK